MPHDPLPIGDFLARIGDDFGAGGWRTIDQATIDGFADVTDDHQFIHVDPVRAAATPLGTTIAHGFLVLSQLPAMVDEALPPVGGMTMGLNYGFDRVRFLAPVPVGARIRGRFHLKDLKPRSDRTHLFTWEVTVELEGGAKPALSADWLYLIETG